MRDENFNEFKNEFTDPELFNFIKRKGIYFYDYVDSFGS